MDSLENIHVHEKFNTYIVYKEIITVLNLLEKIKYFTLTAFVVKWVSVLISLEIFGKIF